MEAEIAGTSTALRHGDGAARVPFGPETLRSARGDRFYVADSERYAVAVYGMDGKLRRVIRRAWRPEPLTPEEVRRYKEERLADAGAGEGRDVQRRLLEATPFPRTRSAFGRMRVDAEGAVWLQEHVLTADAPGRWSVFDAQGEVSRSEPQPVRRLDREHVLRGRPEHGPGVAAQAEVVQRHLLAAPLLPKDGAGPVVPSGSRV